MKNGRAKIWKDGYIKVTVSARGEVLSVSHEAELVFGRVNMTLGCTSNLGSRATGHVHLYPLWGRGTPAFTRARRITSFTCQPSRTAHHQMPKYNAARQMMILTHQETCDVPNAS
jgi:hypothetical protein